MIKMSEFISKDWTVEQALKSGSQAAGVFLRFKTDCVGCWMARFCTVDEAAQKYRLNLDDLLSALQMAALANLIEE